MVPGLLGETFDLVVGSQQGLVNNIDGTTVEKEITAQKTKDLLEKMKLEKNGFELIVDES